MPLDQSNGQDAPFQKVSSNVFSLRASEYIISNRLIIPSGSGRLQSFVSWCVSQFAMVMPVGQPLFSPTVSTQHSFVNSGFPTTINDPHPPKFDPEWCKFRFIRNLYIIPPDTSRLEELSRILQQQVA